MESMIRSGALESQPAAAPSRLCIHRILLPAVVQYHRVWLTSTPTVMRGTKDAATCSPPRQDLEKQHNGSVCTYTPLEVLVDILGVQKSLAIGACKSGAHHTALGPGHFLGRLSPPSPVRLVHLDGFAKSPSCNAPDQGSPTRRSP